VRIAAGVAGLLACYSLGTVWYMVMYLQDGGWAAVLLKCVIPYVLPDALKLAMAFSLAGRIQRRVSMN
jgi:biotin transport system substrate-specific component